MAVQEINDLTLKASAAATDELELQETGGGDSKKTTVAGLLAGAGGVAASLFDAHTVLAATVDNTPAALVVGEQTVVGRITGGNIAALSVAQLQTLANVEDGADVTDATNVDAAGAVMEADFDANTILAATADNTPTARTIAEQQVVGRLTGEAIKGLSVAELQALANVEDGADVTDATNVNAAGAVMEADYDAQTILMAVADDTPTAVTVAEDRIVGRKTGGDVGVLTAAEVNAILGLLGVQTMYIPADLMYVETTAGPAALTTTELVAGQPEVRGFAFDTGSDEAVQFTVAMPKRWNEGTVTFQPIWTTADAGADGVCWSLAGKYIGDGSAIAGAFGTQQDSVDNAQSSAYDVLVGPASAAITIGGTPAEGGLCVFRAFRDTDNAGDDLAADAILLGIKLYWTPADVNDA